MSIIRNRKIALSLDRNNGSNYRKSLTGNDKCVTVRRKKIIYNS